MTLITPGPPQMPQWGRVGVGNVWAQPLADSPLCFPLPQNPSLRLVVGHPHGAWVRETCIFGVQPPAHSSFSFGPKLLTRD